MQPKLRAIDTEDVRCPECRPADTSYPADGCPLCLGAGHVTAARAAHYRFRRASQSLPVARRT